MKSPLIRLFGPGVRWKMRRQLARTIAAAEDCRATQTACLQRLLQLNRGSQFSKDFGLDAVRTPDQFRQALPVADYERAAPYLEQVKAGKPDALLGVRNPIRMFALTSGTTGSCKYVPVTSTFLKDYRRGWQDWGIKTFDDHPALYERPVYQVCSDFDRFRTSGGTPCGNISGLVQHMQKRIVRSLFTVPKDALKIADPVAKMYYSLKHSLLARDLGMITTANPSTLIQIFRMLSDQAEYLIRDLHDGTNRYLSAFGVAGSQRFPKNVQRARELGRLLEQDGALTPRRVWPDLQVLAVWTGGSAASYLPLLRKLSGGLPVRDHGLHASEGRMTIPLANETSAGLLDTTAHYFEFIPEREIHSAQPIALAAHELEAGANYYIILTTSSGLYRYDIRDVVQCTGFHGTTPLLRFLHKGSHICSLTGEKLTESHVVQAVSCVMDRGSLHLNDFTLAPEWGDPPRYVLLLEEDQLPAPELQQAFTADVDRELLRINPEYQEKRSSGRLGDLSLKPVPAGTWRQFRELRQSQSGGSFEQYKHPFLAPRIEFIDEISRLDPADRSAGHPPATRSRH